ncbi:497_t:CDS:2, partial [Paraglomus occultum]
PGVRTFLTCSGCIGNGDAQRIVRLSLCLDNLISRTAQAPSRKFYAPCMRQRIKNLIDECHHQTALWLVCSFDVIITPPFNNSRMARRRHRKINNRTVQKMMTWAHGRFRARLISKAEEFGKEVKIVGEAYTSKTCSRCGWINQNLGEKKYLNVVNVNFG